MAKTLISSPSSSSIFAVPLPSVHRHGRRGLGAPVHRPRGVETKIKMSFQEIPLLDLSSVVSRAEGILYAIADAVAAAAAQKNRGWFGFFSDAMEVVLKVLKDGLETVHVPYAYGLQSSYLPLL